MQESLSGALYVVEVVLWWLNPAPLVVLSEDSIVPLALGMALLLVFAIYDATLRDYSSFGRGTAIVIAACVAAITFLSLTPELRRLLVGMSVMYAMLFRMIDGLLVGIAIGALVRKVGTRRRSTSAHAVDFTPIVLGVTAISWILTAYGLYRMVRTMPLMIDHPLAIVAIAGYTLCGLLLMPTFGGPALYLLYLAVFPACVVLGLFARPTKTTGT